MDPLNKLEMSLDEIIAMNDEKSSADGSEGHQTEGEEEEQGGDGDQDMHETPVLSPMIIREGIRRFSHYPNEQEVKMLSFPLPSTKRPSFMTQREWIKNRYSNPNFRGRGFSGNRGRRNQMKVCNNIPMRYARQGRQNQGFYQRQHQYVMPRIMRLQKYAPLRYWQQYDGRGLMPGRYRSNGITRDALAQFNAKQGMNYRNGNFSRTPSIASLRSRRSLRSNQSHYSNRSTRSIRSFRSNRSASMQSNVSRGSLRSIRTFRSNNSFKSNHSFRSNQSRRSIMSIRSQSSRQGRQSMAARAAVNNRGGIKRFRAVLDWNIQNKIAQVQSQYSAYKRNNSPLMRTCIDPEELMPVSFKTNIHLTDRFSRYSLGQ